MALPSLKAQYPFDKNMLTWRDNGISKQKRHAVIIHTDESAYDYTTGKVREKGWTATQLAQYNIDAPNDKNRGSYHGGVDEAAHAVRQNDDIYGTWSTGNQGNDECLHFCFAGTTAYFTRAQWLKRTKQLRRMAEIVAHACLRYDIPIRRATPAMLRNKAGGIGGHWDCTKAWSNGSGHWDPGGYEDTAGGFPWDVFMSMVAEAAKNDSAKPATVAGSSSIKENPVIQKIKSLINPAKSFTSNQLLALIDGSIWKQERLMRAICEKLEIDADAVIKKAIDHDLAGGK